MNLDMNVGVDFFSFSNQMSASSVLDASFQYYSLKHTCILFQFFHAALYWVHE